MQMRKCSSMDSVEPQTGLRPAGQVSPGFYSDPLCHPSSSQQERDPLRPGFFQSVPAQHLPHQGRENCCTDSRTMVQMVKNLPANARDSRDAGLICVGKTPGEGNVNPLQYSCLENDMDRRAWWATQPMGWQRVGHD